MTASSSSRPNPGTTPLAERVTVVMATRDRRANVLTSLERLLGLPGAPPVTLVDDASSDGTADAVRERFPGAEVVRLPECRGSAARTEGVVRADTPYVAFADDDSWYAPGALDAAADLLDAHPRLALVAARVLVGDDERLDPTCEVMAASPVDPVTATPRPAVLGFVACGAVVRRDAYLEVGGFHPRYAVGGEERLLALDLAQRGWGLAYAAHVVAHHHPAGDGVRPGRAAAQVRNDLWTTWLRRPLPAVALGTAGILAGGRRRPAATASGVAAALRGLPWVLRHRRPVASGVEAQLRRL